MSTTFKTKTKVKKVKKNDLRVTLDAKHEEKKNYFKNLNESLIEKEEHLKDLIEKKNQFEKVKLEDLDSESFDNYLEFKDKIIEVEKEIINIKNNEEESNYLLNTGQLVFKYYENINKIAQGEKPTKIKEKSSFPKKKNVKNKQTVVDFFQNKKQVDTINKFDKYSVEKITDKDLSIEKEDFKNGETEITCPDKGIMNVKVHNNKNKDDQKEFYQSRIAILNKYLSIVDNEYCNELSEEENDSTLCPECNSEMFTIQNEALLICKECGTSEYIMIDSDKPSYKDPPKEISYFAYKRINHFNEWLAQFQAKESTDIPDHVYEQVLIEIKKERIENMANLKPKKLRDLLKKLKLNKYYEHVPHIINRLNGIPAPVMTRETEEILRMMFKEIQNPFMKYCPKDRKNFLSYSYVLHKFVQLLNLDEFLICFPLLKSREKLHHQDLIWKKICEDLQWEFIKSL